MKKPDLTKTVEQELKTALKAHQFGVIPLSAQDLTRIYTALSRDRVTERHAKLVIASAYQDIQETIGDDAEKQIILAWLKGFKDRFLTELLALYK